MYEINRLDKDIDNIIAGTHPETSDPLIQIAKNISSLNKISPRRTARDINKQAYLTKATEQIRAKQTVGTGLIRKTFRQTWFNMRRLAAASLIFLMMSSSTVYAANSSMPDSWLYPVKRATESARLSIAGSRTKTKVELFYAKRRLIEAKFLAKNKPALLDSHVDEVLSAIKILKEYTPKSISEEKSIKNILKEATKLSTTKEKKTPKLKKSKITPNLPALGHGANKETLKSKAKTSQTNKNSKQPKQTKTSPGAQNH